MSAFNLSTLHGALRHGATGPGLQHHASAACCLYDYGPNQACSIDAAADDLIAMFEDGLAEGEADRLRKNLHEIGGHRFEQPQEAGAAYCEVTDQR